MEEVEELSVCGRRGFAKPRGRGHKRPVRLTVPLGHPGSCAWESVLGTTDPPGTNLWVLVLNPLLSQMLFSMKLATDSLF